jgi:hypothetical protein
VRAPLSGEINGEFKQTPLTELLLLLFALSDDGTND